MQPYMPKISILAKLRYVSAGTYRLKLMALKVFGNREYAKDWEEWVSPPLRVTR
jgi:hypothetical protein